jgi:predicted PurR-regulated permease PerM
MLSHLTRHRGLIVFTLGIVAIFIIFYALRMAILPFVVGLALAYILIPFITWAENHLPRPGRYMRLKRVSLVVFCFLAIIALMGTFIYVFSTALVNSFQSLLTAAPEYLSGSFGQVQAWLDRVISSLPADISRQIDGILQNAGETFSNTVNDFFQTGVGGIQNAFSVVLGFAALPIFLFYFMKDHELVQRSFYAAFSPWLAMHIRNIVEIIERVLGRYIKAQLLLGAIVAYITFLGLFALNVWPDDTGILLALALLAGLTEMIPTVGPWIGGIVAVVFTLAVAPDKVLWVAILYLGVQLIENNLLVPRIQGGYLRIHPAAAIMLLVIGAYVAGFWGLLLAVPLTATVIEIYKYLRGSARDEGGMIPASAWQDPETAD